MRRCEWDAMTNTRVSSLADHYVCSLKLRVYRNMGIDAERDQNTGEYTRAVVRNPQRSDVHVFDLSEEHGDIGTVGLADQVWTCLPG